VEFDRHGIVIGKEGHFRHKNIFDVMKLIPIGDEVDIVYFRHGEYKNASARAMRNPVRGVLSCPVIDERKFIEVFGMIVQELSFDIIEAMHQVDTHAQIDMLKTIDEDSPVLVVTHIHQGTQADEMEWSAGELINKVNDQEVHTISELERMLQKSKRDNVLIECRSGMIGYFRVE
jgi:hypothetical protein